MTSRSRSREQIEIGRRSRLAALRREGFDQPPGDTRREQRVSVGYRADRPEQFDRFRVLDQETARAGADGFEDVLVDLEGGEHHDLHRTQTRVRR